MNLTSEIVPALPREVGWAKKLVRIMDDAFEIPVFRVKVGLDPIIGLIPGVGDVIAFVISVGILISIVRHGAPSKIVLKMIFNVVIDLIIGGIPVIGDIWDFFFKANRKNLQMLIEFHEGKLEAGKLSD